MLWVAERSKALISKISICKSYREFKSYPRHIKYGDRLFATAKQFTAHSMVYHIFDNESIRSYIQEYCHVAFLPWNKYNFSEFRIYKLILEDSFYVEKIFIVWLLIFSCTYKYVHGILFDCLDYVKTFYMITGKFYVLELAKKYLIDIFFGFCLITFAKHIEKHIIEYLGPRGLLDTTRYFIRKGLILHTGSIYHYILWFIVGICLLMLVL